MKAIVGWSLLGLFCGSLLAFVVVYAIDEWHWRQVERRAGRR
jgi:hypothetical protein